MFDNENLFIKQGWQCPICKRVYSPTTSLCLYCGNKQYTANVATGYNLGYTDQLGKRIFLTHEEVEQASKEREK